MRNKDIREALKQCNVKYWELAEKMEISQSWLSVKLRQELTSEEKYRIFSLIAEIMEERKVEA